MPQWSWANGKSTFKLYFIWLKNHPAHPAGSQQKNDGKSTQSTDWKREATIWKEFSNCHFGQNLWSDLVPEDLEGLVAIRSDFYPSVILIEIFLKWPCRGGSWRCRCRPSRSSTSWRPASKGFPPSITFVQQPTSNKKKRIDRNFLLKTKVV